MGSVIDLSWNLTLKIELAPDQYKMLETMPKACSYDLL